MHATKTGFDHGKGQPRFMRVLLHKQGGLQCAIKISRMSERTAAVFLPSIA